MSRFVWPATLLVAVALACLSNLLPVPDPLRVTITALFVLVCPGMAWAVLLGLPNRWYELTLGVGLSLMLLTAIALVMVYAHAWSAGLAFGLLVGLTLLGAAAQVVNPTIFNLVAAHPAQDARRGGRFRWRLMFNASSVIGSSVVTAGLGFAFWWYAARSFPAPVIGLASAATSAMLLLGSVGTLGLGTWLLGEVQQRRERAGALVSAALVAAFIVGASLGTGFAVIAGGLSTELAPLSSTPGSQLLFGVGVGLAAVTMVFDEAVIGLLQGTLHLWRNGLASAVKLSLLAAAVGLGLRLDGVGIFATWVVGHLVSIGSVALYASFRGILALRRPTLEQIRDLPSVALNHHAINLSLQGVGNVLPVVVTGLFSSDANAGFYVAWMIAAFGFFPPQALASVLYAMRSAHPGALAARVRFTLGVSALITLGYVGIVIFAAHPILALFGQGYAASAETSLKLLVLASFPIIIKAHYVVIGRIQNRLNSVLGFALVGTVLELGLALVGARVGGLTGLCVGFVTATSLEALAVAHSVFRVAALRAPRREPASLDVGVKSPPDGTESASLAPRVQDEAVQAEHPAPQSAPGGLPAVRQPSQADRERRGGSVCAVIVTYNRPRMLASCLASVYWQTHQPDAILIIDNGGADDSGMIARAGQHQQPATRVVRLETNLGPAGGFRAGIEEAYAMGFAWAWLLDDDSFAEPDALDALITALKAIPASLQPNILTGEAFGLDGLPHPVTRPVFGLSLRARWRWARRDGPISIRAASFVSTLLRLEAVATQGLPLADYFVWNDDVEYTARLLRSRRGVFVPASRVIHASSESKRPFASSDDRFYYEVRNKLWMIRHSPAWTGLERLGWLAHLSIAVTRYLATNRLGAVSRSIVLTGLRHGLFRRPGTA